ncbi:MAG TPA: hypothetical protein VFI65_33625 [Streptosporangiaceae bacterium]|nr:hypothetical protein [Streptosporangiaceae bacterium]
MSSTSLFNLPISLIVILLASVGLIVGLPVLLVGTSVWVSTGRASKRGAGDGTSRAVLRRARIGRIGGLLVGALMAFLTYIFTNVILAPAFAGVGYLLGILVFELRPSIQPVGPIRVASLQARNAWQYLSRRVLRTTIVVAFLTVVAPAPFVLASPSDYRTELLVQLSVPFAVITAIALAAWVPLMARVASLPQQATDAGESGRAATSRANAARAVTGAVLGIAIISLSGDISASSALINHPDGALYIFGRILVLLGFGLSIAGIVAWSILSRWRSAPVEPADPAPAEPRIA